VARGSRGALSLPRDERLRRPSEFQTVFQQGKREECQGFVALWSRGSGGRKVGFAVSRRVRGAVNRNRARRRLREAYRQQQHLMPDALQVVFVGRHTTLTEPFKRLVGEMQRMMAMLGQSGEARRRKPATAPVSKP